MRPNVVDLTCLGYAQKLSKSRFKVGLDFLLMGDLPQSPLAVSSKMISTHLILTHNYQANKSFDWKGNGKGASLPYQKKISD